MKLSIVSTNVLKFFKKHTIDTIVDPIEEIIEKEISKINCPIKRQNYITRVVLDLYNNGDQDAAFYISNKYRNETQSIYPSA